jgi:hypothetical protein
MRPIDSGKDTSLDASISPLKTRAWNKLRSLLVAFGLIGGAVAYNTSDTVRDAVDGGVKNISESVTQSHVISFSDTPIDQAREMIQKQYAPEEVQDVLGSFDNRIAELEITHKGTVATISGDYYRSWEQGNSFFPYWFDRNHSVKMSDDRVISADVDQAISENPK